MPDSDRSRDLPRTPLSRFCAIGRCSEAGSEFSAGFQGVVVTALGVTLEVRHGVLAGLNSIGVVLLGENSPPFNHCACREYSLRGSIAVGTSTLAVVASDLSSDGVFSWSAIILVAKVIVAAPALSAASRLD